MSLLWSAGAVGAFHVAYSTPDSGSFIVIYLLCLVQLAHVLPTTRQAFYFGLGTGLLCVAPQLTCFWVIFGPTAIVLWLILAFWIGMFVALARVSLVRFGPIWGRILIPFLWVGLEYFRSELYYLRFSWLNAGYALAYTQLRPLLNQTGMYGAGFLWMTVAVGLSSWRTRKPLLAVVRPMAGILAIGFVFAWAEAVKPAAASGRSVRVAGAQLEFPVPTEAIGTLDSMLAANPQTELFVLSEYTFDGPVPAGVKAWCREHQKYLIAGGKLEAPKNEFYNTAFVVGPAGEVVFSQAKSVPIQFFKDGLRAPEQKVWESPWGKMGICICYDLSYSLVTDQLIRLGAQALIVPTMDVADWGKRQHELHARVAPVRAAEYGVPIFRLASSGVSQSVDRSGKVTASAPFPGPGLTLSGELTLGPPGTLPVDRWLAPLATVVTGLTTGWLVFMRRKKTQQSAEISEDECQPTKEAEILKCEFVI